jgi:hypothetical protein
MPSFPIKGSAGPSTPTVWMSPLADKWTMGVKATASGFTYLQFMPTNAAVSAVHFVNQMVANNASFGGFMTAPDGTTNTAQKLVEDSSNNYHFAEVGMQGLTLIPNCRMAGIYHAGDRTRVAFQACSNDQHYGVAVCFDLAGGQIGWAPQSFGFGQGDGSRFNYIAIGASIQPLQGYPGWYLCMFDYTILGQPENASTNFERVYIDKGSGTTAFNNANLQYVGNGTGGIFGWRCSTLPVGAWAMTGNTVFFDDFNDPTMANIDLNGTYADDFDWYLNGFTPGYLACQPLPKANVVQSGSAITIVPITPVAPYTFNAALCSWGNPGDGRPHGAKGRNTHTPPVMFEAKVKFPFGLPEDEISISFLQTVEFCDELSRSAHVTGAPPYIQGDGSIRNWNIGGWAPTWGDAGGGSAVVPGGIGTTQFLTAFNPAPYTLSNSYGVGISPGLYGIPQWIAQIANTSGYYGNVSYNQVDGIFYQGIVNDPPQARPPTSDYAVYTYPPGAFNTFQPAVFVDQTQYQVYTLLIIPYNRVTKDRGCFMTWGNGVFTGGCVWAPGDPFADGIPHTTDWQRLFWMIQAGIHSGSGFGFTFDYAKVTK